MIDKKDTRPVAGTTGRAEAENSLAGVFPCLNCTTAPAQRQAIYKSLRAIAFEVNRIAAIIQLAGLETGDDV